jgi:hypothetical protein
MSTLGISLTITLLPSFVKFTPEGKKNKLDSAEISEKDLLIFAKKMVLGELLYHLNYDHSLFV